jgi:predicted nucleic acid-binding Zn ribbon protein
LTRHYDDELDDSDDDWESSAGDDDSSDENPTTPCPFCGESIYDDAERCPACGKYLSLEDAPAGQRPLWIVMGVVACLAIVILWAIFG